MLSGTQHSFDPDLTLSGAFLLHVKSTTPSATTPSATTFDVFIYPFIFFIEYSLRIENTARDTHISILNELQRAVSVAVIPSSRQTGPSTYAWPVFFEVEQTHLRDLRHMFLVISLNDTDAFFVYAFKHRLYSYVQYRLSKGQPFDTKIDNNSLLLTSAVMAMDLKMLQLLFDSGANPNNSEHGYTWTPWHEALRAANNATNDAKNGALGGPKGADKCAEIVKIFLDHGADPSAMCGDRTAKAIIKNFQTWDPKWTKETLSTLEALEKPQKATKRYSHAFQGLFKRGDAKK
jgi:hypothetical protein